MLTPTLNRRMVSGLIGAVSILAQTTWGQVAEESEPHVYDVEMLADGTILYAADFGYTAAPGDVDGPPAVGNIDWNGNLLRACREFRNSACQCWLTPNRPRSAQQLPSGDILFADTGNHRIVTVDGLAYREDDLSDMFFPVSDAKPLGAGGLLLVDGEGHRVIELDGSGDIVWQFGTTGVAGAGATRLRFPEKAERLANGNTLIADTGNHRIIEVTPGNQLVWSFAALNAPHGAQRLANGNTLIADTGNQRIIEVTAARRLVRTIATNGPVYDVERLASGTILAGGAGWVREYTGAGQIVRSVVSLSP